MYVYTTTKHRLQSRKFRVSYPRGAERRTITYSRGISYHGEFQVSQVVPMPLGSVIQPFRVPSLPLEGRRRMWAVVQVQKLPCKQLQPQRNGDTSYGSSADGGGAQTELRSLTSESWTEPQKWKSLLKRRQKEYLGSLSS